MNYITSKVELGERSARNRWLTFLFVLLIGIAVSGFIATSAKACGSSCTVGSQGGPSGSGGTAGFEWITFGCTNEDGPDGQPNTGNCGFNAAKTPDQDGGTATTYAFNRFMSAATGNTNTGVQTQTSITNYLNGSTGGPNILSECQQSAFIFALMETPGTTSFNSNSYALDPGEYDTALQTSNEITTKVINPINSSTNSYYYDVTQSSGNSANTDSYVNGKGTNTGLIVICSYTGDQGITKTVCSDSRMWVNPPQGYTDVAGDASKSIEATDLNNQSAYEGDCLKGTPPAAVATCPSTGTDGEYLANGGATIPKSVYDDNGNYSYTSTSWAGTGNKTVEGLVGDYCYADGSDYWTEDFNSGQESASAVGQPATTTVDTNYTTPFSSTAYQTIYTANTLPSPLASSWDTIAQDNTPTDAAANKPGWGNGPDEFNGTAEDNNCSNCGSNAIYTPLGTFIVDNSNGQCQNGTVDADGCEINPSDLQSAITQISSAQHATYQLNSTEENALASGGVMNVKEYTAYSTITQTTHQKQVNTGTADEYTTYQQVYPNYVTQQAEDEATISYRFYMSGCGQSWSPANCTGFSPRYSVNVCPTDNPGPQEFGAPAESNGDTNPSPAGDQVEGDANVVMCWSIGLVARYYPDKGPQEGQAVWCGDAPQYSDDTVNYLTDETTSSSTGEGGYEAAGSGNGSSYSNRAYCEETSSYQGQPANSYVNTHWSSGSSVPYTNPSYDRSCGLSSGSNTSTPDGSSVDTNCSQPYWSWSGWQNTGTPTYSVADQPYETQQLTAFYQALSVHANEAGFGSSEYVTTGNGLNNQSFQSNPLYNGSAVSATQVFAPFASSVNPVYLWGLQSNDGSANAGYFNKLAGYSGTADPTSVSNISNYKASYTYFRDNAGTDGTAKEITNVPVYDVAAGQTSVNPQPSGSTASATVVGRWALGTPNVPGVVCNDQSSTGSGTDAYGTNCAGSGEGGQFEMIPFADNFSNEQQASYPDNMFSVNSDGSNKVLPTQLDWGTSNAGTDLTGGVVAGESSEFTVGGDWPTTSPDADNTGNAAVQCSVGTQSGTGSGSTCVQTNPPTLDGQYTCSAGTYNASNHTCSTIQTGNPPTTQCYAVPGGSSSQSQSGNTCSYVPSPSTYLANCPQTGDQYVNAEGGGYKCYWSGGYSGYFGVSCASGYRQYSPDNGGNYAYYCTGSTYTTCSADGSNYYVNGNACDESVSTPATEGYSCASYGAGWSGPNASNVCTKSSNATFSCPAGWSGPNAAKICTNETGSPNVFDYAYNWSPTVDQVVPQTVGFNDLDQGLNYDSGAPANNSGATSPVTNACAGNSAPASNGYLCNDAQPVEGRVNVNLPSLVSGAKTLTPTDAVSQGLPTAAYENTGTGNTDVYDNQLRPALYNVDGASGTFTQRNGIDCPTASGQADNNSALGPLIGDCSPFTASFNGFNNPLKMTAGSLFLNYGGCASCTYGGAATVPQPSNTTGTCSASNDSSGNPSFDDNGTYCFEVEVTVNGTQVMGSGPNGAFLLSPKSSTVAIPVSNVPANATVTIQWLNDVYSSGFYDSNFAIYGLTLMPQDPTGVDEGWVKSNEWAATPSSFNAAFQSLTFLRSVGS